MRAALAFLTPLGGARAPSPRALPWFPIVGALIGLGVGGVWWAGTEVWTPAVGAALAVVADLALTGMLHIDGLADSADGLLPHLTRERRLEVMAKPDIGAFGVAAIGGALLVEFAVLASTDPRPLVVIAIWAALRALVAAVLAAGRYARPGGLATAFAGGGRTATTIVGIVLVALAWPRVDAPVLGCVAALAIVALGYRKLGGYTGDVLGAAIVVGQVVALLAVAA